MSANQLSLKAQQHEREARFEAVSAIIIGIGLAIFFARAYGTVHAVVPRMGMGLLSLWGIYYAYQAYKWMWPGRLMPDATLDSTLQYYRSELEGRGDYHRHLWLRAGLPFCFLGIAMVILPALIQSFNTPRLLLNLAPVFVLFLIWCAIFFPRRKRIRRKLQREIEELRRLEREVH